MANDKPCLHLPLDEIRYVEETAQAQNVGGIGSDAIVRGNPKILHDPTMGTCMPVSYTHLTLPTSDLV